MSNFAPDTDFPWAELEYYRALAKHSKLRANAEALIAGANKLMDEAKEMETSIDTWHKKAFGEGGESWTNC